ncbi:MULTISPECIES: YaaL family protein [Salimicrobium]|uniref:DUF2508 family protein n=2 Tax=Salimicrobium TaxID=351195 RepID=A0ABY1KZW4_9BACI|nr:MULTISPECIES: YaaL family protein [Salimicrobium]SDY33138.1 Protein of unknown function [Salimicrobium album]SIS98878.1 Protein of unknown function [Salimicrobium salexigens]
MFNRKRKRKREEKRLIESIGHAHREWSELARLMEHNFHASEEEYRQITVAKAKYFYLLREAREREINVL